MNCTYLDKDYEFSGQPIRLQKQASIPSVSLEEI